MPRRFPSAFSRRRFLPRLPATLPIVVPWWTQRNKSLSPWSRTNIPPPQHSSRQDFDCYDASPTQIRCKTESPRRPLSFPPNLKSSHALNHRQSDLQEAFIRQPCPPAMDVSREINPVGPQVLIFLSNNRKLLEMNFSLPSYTYLGSWQIISLGKKILETVGDALRFPILLYIHLFIGLSVGLITCK